METFKFEEPTIERKEDAIDYINEHKKYNSEINGTGGLRSYIDDYETWLSKIELRKRNGELTYFLVRENDNKIIGMINIRLILNERLQKCGGHIGYGIRPTERKKGYNKINLYLGLQVCQKYGLDKVLLDAEIENEPSWKTMEALGGKKIKEFYNEVECMNCVRYEIDIEKSLRENEKIYANQIKR